MPLLCSTPLIQIKDVDGLHPLNMGRLVREEDGLRSCTPYGVMRLLSAYDIDGRSVGRL